MGVRQATRSRRASASRRTLVSRRPCLGRPRLTAPGSRGGPGRRTGGWAPGADVLTPPGRRDTPEAATQPRGRRPRGRPSPPCRGSHRPPPPGRACACQVPLEAASRARPPPRAPAGPRAPGAPPQPTPRTHARSPAAATPGPSAPTPAVGALRSRLQEAQACPGLPCGTQAHCKRSRQRSVTTAFSFSLHRVTQDQKSKIDAIHE
jgi:hypothetical protein